MYKSLLIISLVFSLISCGEQTTTEPTISQEGGLSTDHANEFRRDIIQIEKNIYIANENKSST